MSPLAVVPIGCFLGLATAGAQVGARLAQPDMGGRSPVHQAGDSGASMPVVFEGYVLDPDGTPATGSFVASSAGGRTIVDAEGFYRLEAPVPLSAQRVLVTASRGSGRVPTASASVELFPGATRVPVDTLSLALGGSCSPVWVPTFGEAPGTNHIVHAVTAFDDGTGEALYAGGFFVQAGGTVANKVAKWDGSTWSPLPGVSGQSGAHVKTLATFDDGTGEALYAGGALAIGMGVGKWNGSSWSSIAAVGAETLTVFDDGSGEALYAGGGFTSIGGVAANNVARWDGASWSPLGAGTNAIVYALAVFDDGTGDALYATGDFTTAGGVTVNHIAKWDGSAWSPLGSGLEWFAPPLTRSLAVFDDGGGPALYVGGVFHTAGGVAADNIARWDGSAWSPVGAGLESLAYALAVFDDGTGNALYAGGGFTTAGGGAASRVARWDGTTWSPLGAGTNDIVRALTVVDVGSGDVLCAGGDFTLAGGEGRLRVARWDGSSWSSLGDGLDSTVRALVEHDDGSGPAIFLGGDFRTDSASRIAKWDGSSLSPLGSGLNSPAQALAVYDDGGGTALFAGGVFTTAGGAAAERIARWDGSSWSPLGSGLDDQVVALATYDDGGGEELYAGGSFSNAGGAPASFVASWDGLAWSPLGAGTDGDVHALAVFDDGGGEDLYAGGNFLNAGGAPASFIARWDGLGWSQVGSGTNNVVEVLTVFDDGGGPALYAGGAFSNAGGSPAFNIAKWDGSSWSSVGSGTNAQVSALKMFDDGTGQALYAGGTFTSAGGGAASRIAKWDGSSWLPLGSGMNSNVFALASYDDGSGPALFAGGFFSRAIDSKDAFLARWACPPPPDLVVSDIQGPAGGETGETVEVSWTIENLGPGDASGPWSDEILASDDAVIGGDVSLDTVPFAGNLPVGESILRTAQVELPVTPGTYRIVVSADSADEVFEDPNEGNNEAIDDAIFTVVQAELPDLVVESVTGPPSGVLSGSTVQVSYTVRNTGAAATLVPSWRELVFLRDSPQIPAVLEDVVADVLNQRFLPAGDSYTVQHNLTLPSDIAGTRYLGVYADARPVGGWTPGLDFDVEELDENNNTAFSASFDVTLEPQPDLVALQGTMAFPGVAPSGTRIDVTWTERNDDAPPGSGGPTDTGSWRTDVYLSPNNAAQIDPGDILLGSSVRSGVQLQGGEQDATRSVTNRLLAPDLSGFFYLKLSVDAADAISELGFETNNVQVSASQIEVLLSVAPDLQPSSISGPASAAFGQPIEVSWSVQNNNESAPIAYDASWNDEIFLSDDTVLDPGTDTLLVTAGQTAVSDGTFLVGGTYTKMRTVTVPSSLAPGTYFLIVAVDRADQVFEGFSGEEGNNVLASAAMTVTDEMPDLSIVANTDPGSQVPPSAAPGEKGLAASWTVTNAGDTTTPEGSWDDGIYLVRPSGDTLLRRVTRQGALGVGQSYQVVTTFDAPVVLPGSFQLALRTDIGGAVFEGASPPANNEALLPFEIRAELPDLVVVSPSGPATITPGTPAAVTWTVQNDGTAAASTLPWSDDVHLSTDTVLDGGDLPLGGRTNVAALGIGQSYAAPQQAMVTVPLGTAPGSYHLLVRADSGGRVLELDEGNNVTAVPMTVTVGSAAAANLIVTEVTSPATVLSGQPLEVTWTVQNVGEADTNVGSWRDSIYLSRDGTLDPVADTLIGTFAHSATLAMGASRQETASFRVPFGHEGAYFLFVVVNSDGRVFEDGRSSDNDGFREGIVDVTLPTGTLDLALSQVTAPASAEAGSDVLLQWQLENAGDTTFNATWTNAIYLSADGMLDGSDRLVELYDASVTSLMPGVPQARQRTVTVPAVAPGAYRWIVLADVRHQLPELEEETNNLAVSAATTDVTAIELLLDSSALATLSTGQERLFQIDLPADRTVRIDSSHDSPGAWTELFALRGAAPTPGLFDQASTLPGSPTQALVIPDSALDTYYLLVRATAGVQAGMTQVTLSATDLPFGVTSVSPTLVGRGRVTLVIEGSRFDGATELAIRHTGGHEVEATEVEIVDAATARARFELATAPLGTYDVLATSTISTDVLPAALEVEPALPLAVRTEIERTSRLRAGTDRTVLVTLENTTNVDVPIAAVVLGTWDDPLAQLSVPDLGVASFTVAPGETRAMAPLLVRDLAVGTREVVGLKAGVDASFPFSELPVFAFARAYSEVGFANGPLQDLFDLYRADVLADPDAQEFWRDAAADRDTFLASLKAATLTEIEATPGPDGFLQGTACAAASFGVARACALHFDPCGMVCLVLCAQVQAAADLLCGELPACLFTRSCPDVVPAPDPVDRDLGILTPPVEPSGTSSHVQVLAVFLSQDPNEIVGPAGAGPERYASNASTLNYLVYFENLSTATAPAGKVELTSALGPEYDLSTFRLLGMGVGGVESTVPANKSFFSEVVELPDPDVDLEYTAGVRVDPMTGGGEVFWELTAVDPSTGTPILNDPLVGFLPPEDGTGAGQGFVQFSVRPKGGFPTGTLLETSARIVFDENEVIETNTVFNTLDADAPSTTLGLVSLDVASELMTLSLQGADTAGAGLDAFVIQASVDGSQYARIGETRAGTIELPVERGRTYALYSQGVDLVGNEEPAPAQPDLVVSVPPIRPLLANLVVIDPNEGGTQILTLNAGHSYAGRAYTILGSMSGTQPGTTLGGVHLPLNEDDYFRATLDGAGEIPIVAARGTLDEFGRAEARIEIPPSVARELVGARMHHAFVLSSGRKRVPDDPQPLFDFASNAEPLRIEAPRLRKRGPESGSSR